jgi:hypothetical protein
MDATGKQLLLMAVVALAVILATNKIPALRRLVSY